MNRSFVFAALLLTAACGQQEAAAPRPPMTSPTPAAPVAKAEVPSLKGTWRVAGASGLTADLRGRPARASPKAACAALDLYAEGQFGQPSASAPGGSSNCGGRTPSAALEAAFGPLSDANLAVFSRRRQRPSPCPGSAARSSSSGASALPRGAVVVARR